MRWRDNAGIIGASLRAPLCLGQGNVDLPAGALIGTPLSFKTHIKPVFVSVIAPFLLSINLFDATEFNRHFSINYNKNFICIIMVMPDEVALKFHKLEMIVIHLGNDFR